MKKDKVSFICIILLGVFMLGALTIFLIKFQMGDSVAMSGSDKLASVTFESVETGNAKPEDIEPEDAKPEDTGHEKAGSENVKPEDDTSVAGDTEDREEDKNGFTDLFHDSEH